MSAQPELPFGAAPDVYALVRSNAHLFRDDFPAWLAENAHVWLAFEREANKLWDRGRTHYSARTIVHFLRHESATREASGEWKINNNVSPDLARLYVLVYPAREAFFEFRVVAGSEHRSAA